MQTVWNYSTRHEAERLIHCAHQIATGFFKINGFIVLPYPAIAEDNIVSIPTLPYLSIPRFWQRASRIDLSTLPIIAPKDLVDETEDLIKKANLPQPDFSQLKELWDKNQDTIIKTIYQVIPGKKDSISKIEIWPTAFGTGCSFNRHKKPGDSIILWLRADQNIGSIVEAILTSLTRQDVYDQLGGLWQESEIIVDWLLTFSPLAEIIKKIDPDWTKTLTIKSTRTKQSASLMQRSDKFLHSVGAPAVGIDAIRQIPTSSFSSRERELLDLLIAKSPNFATMDEIGDILFRNNEDAYSLSAIAKAMQRLRDHLEQTGISGSYIQTKRGEGYLLIS
ncbi:MAG: winged helix-turn-helix domain-containing protein [Patescibacteria group bacterium]